MSEAVGIGPITIRQREKDMERTDVVLFVEKNLAEYAKMFVRTLVHPIARFRP